MKSAATKNLQFGYGLSLLLLIISSIASYVSIQNLLDSSKQVDHTNLVISELENTISILKDAETGQRGFIITGKDEFLEPYNGAYEKAEASIDHISELTIDNPSQQRNCNELKNLILKRIRRLDDVLELRRKTKLVDTKDMLLGKMYMDKARKLVKTMVAEENTILKSRTEKLNKFALFTPLLILIAAITSFIITLVSYFRAKNDIIQRNQLLDQLQEKDRDITKRLNIIEGIADKVSNGDYTIKIESVSDKDSLGNLAHSLNKMAESLHYSFTVLSENELLQSGVANLNENMVGEKPIDVLCSDILNATINFTNSKVGAIYTLNEADYLELVATYALSNIHNKRRIDIGEGIIGQVVISKKPDFIENLDENNITISYASGDAKPSYIYVQPIYFDNAVTGVIELASFTKFSDLHKEYLKTIAQGIGVAINSANSRKKLQQLLEETQAQSEELQVQHYELENLNTELEAQAQKLQASEEELKVQQEELIQANKELEVRSQTLEDKNQLIVERNLEIQRKAEELELSTKYKSEFLANMSHELRTPLNSILLLSRLMSENPEENLNEDQIEYAKVIQSSGNGLLSLIDEILDLSKIEAGKMELEFAETPVNSVVSDLKAMFSPIAKDKNLELLFEVDEKVPFSLVTDKLRLEQILKNLLSNALKFTSKGNVKLGISEPTPGSIKFCVHDTGIGISQDKQLQVFEAFQQADGSTRRKFGGTGLGLSISRELAKLLGGDITLKSEPEIGSVFCLIIPVNGIDSKPEVKLTQTLEKAEIVPEVIEPIVVETITKEIIQLKLEDIPQVIADDRHLIDINDKIVLIVEDDVNFAKALLNFTHQRGYKGVIATQGDYGVIMAQHYLPIAILLDIQLPVKDGWEVMEELKSNSATKHIPVHIMSALDAKKESLIKGAVDFINKPVALEQMQLMFSKLEDALNRHPKKVLILEENPKHAEALAYFLSSFNLSTEIKGSVTDGVSALQKDNVDCVILDMGIPDGNAYNTLEKIKQTEGLENLPVIIFTGRNLSKIEEGKLKKYADSIVMKTAHSYQRILDEVALFLHLVEEKSPVDDKKQRNLFELNEVLKDKTVLIADDDVRNIFSLTKALEQVKMKVLSATDGKEALKILNENPEIDVVLMDMMMPEMDGYETTAKIRSNFKFKQLPILAVTAKAMIGDREKCIKAGASDYISKPVDIDQLISLLRVWLYNTPK